MAYCLLFGPRQILPWSGLTEEEKDFFNKYHRSTHKGWVELTQAVYFYHPDVKAEYDGWRLTSPSR